MLKRTFASLLATVGLLAACDAQQPSAAAAAGAAPAQRAAVTVPSPSKAEAPLTGKLATIQQRLEARFPGAPLKGLRESAVPGLYEVMIGRDLIYIDEQVAHYIVGGQLVDANRQVNLTAERASELSAINVAELPIQDAIKVVRGKGERAMYVFTDADCPFCVRLEQTINEMDNVTVYNFLFPIDSLHPDAGRKSRIIWCSEDRVAAWTDYMLKRKLVKGSDDCENPVQRTQALGQALGVTGTPGFYLADGRFISGAIPRERLENELNAALAKAGPHKP